MQRHDRTSVTASIHETTGLDRRQFLGDAVAGALGLALCQARLLAAEADSVTIYAEKDHVDFLAGKELIGRYHIGRDIAKPYFWPLNVPGGVAVTRAWPMVKGLEGESNDHVHQKSAWFCHGDVIPEGIELKVKSKNKAVKGVDFWSEEEGHGRIVVTDVFKPLRPSKDHVGFRTENEWRTADGVKILDENRTIHLYDLGSAKLFVFDIDLHASVCPITFGDTKEGSMGIRINDAIREQKGKDKGPGKLENADGKVTEKECWGQQSGWCDYSGPIDGKIVGLAIFDDPKNEPKACWHARGYGLMAANPFGRKVAGFPAVKDKEELVKLDKGAHLKLRYGLLIHSGDAKDGKVAEHYKEFVKLRG
jgi:hypothetical protein